MRRKAFEIELLPVLADNYSYLLFDPDSGTSGVVDPGAAEPVRARLAELGRGLDLIFVTHHHADHTGGVVALQQEFGARILAARRDIARIPGFAPDRDLALGEGDEGSFGDVVFRVLETPGHTRGHVCYWFPGEEALFCGDTLFAMGCGRLLEGTAEEMWQSLGKLAALPPSTRVWCGHEYTLANGRFALTVDPDNAELAERVREVEALRAEGRPTVPSTLGLELRTNPFLRANDPAIRARLGMEAASEVEVFAELRRRKDRF
ncbi:Hydroxyacylglutathione hydrolase GloB [bacterium HR40]|nr:Hydroxyacylglutathione hydrolase GloB [bacterium HR40]